MPVMTTEAARQIRNRDLFKAEFSLNSDAATGVIIIRTREPTRCYETLQDMAVEDENKFALWDCTQGRLDFPLPQPDRPDIDIRKSSSVDALQIDPGKWFAKLMDERADGFYVMLHPHHHFEKPGVQQYIKNFAQKALDTFVRLVMIVPDTVKIPVEIEDDVYVMDFKPPSHAELVEVWETLVERFDEPTRPNFDDEAVAVVVQNSVGMTANEFEKAASIATIELQPKIKEDRDSVTAQDYVEIILKQKVEVIKKTDILELMQAGSMNEIGGLDLIKSWMAKRAKAYSEEAREYGLEVPKGVLCVGPPGAGKSLFAKASAGVFGVPLIKLDIGRVFGKFVGDSEGRMRSALKLVEAMSPCVLLLDEIDKGFGGIGGGGGDSGVSQRVLGTFLTWMQERDNAASPVFVVMTANNVVGLPAELMRKGRVDEIFAVTFPSPKERADILKIHLTKRGHSLSDAELRKIAEVTDKFVGSEIESIVVDGLIEAFDQGLKKPTVELLVQQARSITPLSKSMADKVNFMNDWAKSNAKPASTGMDFAHIPTDDSAAPPRRRILLRSGGAKPAPRGGRNLDG